MILDSATALAPAGLDGSGPRDVSRWMAVPWQTDTSSCLFAYIGWQEGVYQPTFWPVRVPNNVLTADQYETVMNARKPYSERRGVRVRSPPVLAALPRHAKTTSR